MTEYEYYDTLPQKRMAVGVVLLNENGDLLINYVTIKMPPRMVGR